MAESEESDERHPRGSLDLVESSILDTIVPLESGVDIEEALSGSIEHLDEENGSPLASIPQRQALYFGQSSTLRKKLGILLIHR
jgi:hypothetical protein